MVCLHRKGGYELNVGSGTGYEVLGDRSNEHEVEGARASEDHVAAGSSSNNEVRALKWSDDLIEQFPLLKPKTHYLAMAKGLRRLRERNREFYELIERVVRASATGAITSGQFLQALGISKARWEGLKRRLLGQWLVYSFIYEHRIGDEHKTERMKVWAPSTKAIYVYPEFSRRSFFTEAVKSHREPFKVGSVTVRPVEDMNLVRKGLIKLMKGKVMRGIEALPADLVWEDLDVIFLRENCRIEWLTALLWSLAFKRARNFPFFVVSTPRLIDRLLQLSAWMSFALRDAGMKSDFAFAANDLRLSGSYWRVFSSSPKIDLPSLPKLPRNLASDLLVKSFC